MDSSSSLPSAPANVAPADNGPANLNPTPNPNTTSVTANHNDTPYSSPRQTGNGSDTSSPPSAPAFRQNGHKSCDACKTRKVKCPNVDYPNPCGNCVRRKEACHFGTKKVPRRNVTKHLRYTQPCSSQGESASSTMLRYVDAPNSDGSTGNGSALRGNADPIPSLYVDHMILQAQAQEKTHGKEEFVKGNGIFGGSYSLTFFSESRLLSLSKRLHNNKVGELVRRMNGIISGRLRRSNETSTGDTNATGGSGNRSSSSAASAGPSLYIASVTDDTPPMPVDPEFAASCFRYYFEHVHSIYPFLDRASFEARALPAPGSGEEGEKALAKSLKRSKAWSSLYYTVMAIGCVYSESSGSSSNNSTPAANASFLGHLANMTSKQSSTPGSFEPGKGTAWRLFSMALANLSDLFILPDSLLTLQALTSMVVYGLGVSCLSIERVILAEASRRAQSLASNFDTSAAGSTTSSVIFQRTFWVLYSIEKIMSFHFGRSSTFVDSDIACPIPAIIDESDDSSTSATSVSSTAVNCWFLLALRHARLLSRTYTSLFSVGKARVSTASNLATIDRLCDEAEEWRLSIPSTRGLRPECSSWRGSSRNGPSSFTTHGSSSSKTSMALRSTVLAERNIALALRFLYHSLVVILARARLHHLSLHQADVENQKRKDADGETSPEENERPQLDVQSLERDARRALMTSARGILELTPIVDVEPYVPLWTLAVIPLTALFVLFDLVVDQPNDAPQSNEPASGPRKISSDTALNLALLDMGAGYFSRIEYASNSSLPGSLISEFAHIARDYVNDYQRGVRSVHAPLPPPPPPPENVRRNSPDDDCSGAVHPIPLLQPTTRILSDHPEHPKHPEQRPVPIPPPIMVQQQQSTQPMQPQMNPMGGPAFTGWPPSSVSGVTPVPSTSDGSIPLVGGPNVANFSDSLGYGFGTESYQPGNADFGGTDVMGLFTSNHFFLSEMDGILYNGL